ncbi:OLC1v1022249C1 [Oldenlandia corymbosa var. corymbosa]|uniref:OLC1v1022249C1 n=1 Tax=Oldenlandia corymbosa var. corymbosa TaxID=529605 RepID=A0AAV1C156_OLDCO|nr:OLC1v1022249C1 [Oldenlandia corymbosa var. corymbosa]
MAAGAAREESSKSMIQQHGSSSLPPQYPYPYLAFAHGEEQENQSFFDVTSSEPGTKSIPEFKNEPEVISSQGWLILYHYPGTSSPHMELQLWNPITLESIHLPPLNLGPCDVGGVIIILTKPPTDPDTPPPRIMFRHVQDDDEKDWTYRVCDEEIDKFDDDLEVWDSDFRVVLCNDKIYVLQCLSIASLLPSIL